MLFRNPFFLENMFRDQPYCSLLLVAPYCDGACPGCHNQTLTTENVKEFSVDDLVDEYINNPFVDGITVAGLEICLSGEAFVNDLLAFINKAKVHKITIYSRYSVNDTKLKNILSTIKEFPFVEELYCKTGYYNNHSNIKTVSLISKNKENWKMNLASSNQAFHIIKGDYWQEQMFSVH